MTLVLACVWAVVVVSSDAPAISSDIRTTGDPFAWFCPDVSVSEDALRRMDQREVVSWMLPADGDELALFVGSAIQADARSFAREIDRNERLWSGKHVPHVVRFSTPPRIEDVAQLALQSGDLEALRTCKPGDCGVKLSEPEIGRVRTAIERSPAERWWEESIGDLYPDPRWRRRSLGVASARP